MFQLVEDCISIGANEDYSSAIQNLRLIKKPGINVWNRQNRKWSEASIGEDDKGRILQKHNNQNRWFAC